AQGEAFGILIVGAGDPAARPEHQARARARQIQLEPIGSQLVRNDTHCHDRGSNHDRRFIYRGPSAPSTHREPAKMALTTKTARCGARRIGDRSVGSAWASPPRPPKDPDVRDLRIRLLGSWFARGVSFIR